MTHPIEAKRWQTWLGAIKAIGRAGLTGKYEAFILEPNDPRCDARGPIYVKPV